MNYADDNTHSRRCAPPPLAVVVIHYIPEYSKAGAANRGQDMTKAFRSAVVTNAFVN